MHACEAAVHVVHALPGQEAYYENTIDPGLRQFLMGVRRMSEEFGANAVVIGRGPAREHFEAKRTDSTAIIRQSSCAVLSV